MLDEKHNSNFHWKSKLEELTGLPGEAGFEKDTAWEKLHGRLQEKSRKQKTIWYWAAACVLPALIILPMMTNNKENISVKDLPQQKQNISETPKQLQPQSKETVAVIVPVQAKAKQMITPTRRSPNADSINTTGKENDPVIVIGISPVETKAETVSNTTSPADTVVTATAMVPVKKKMQVIHINELEASPAPMALPGYVKKSLTVKFGNNKTSKQVQQYAGSYKINLSIKN